MSPAPSPATEVLKEFDFSVPPFDLLTREQAVALGRRMDIGFEPDGARILEASARRGVAIGQRVALGLPRPLRCDAVGCPHRALAWHSVPAPLVRGTRPLHRPGRGGERL